jgi:hypothetical protein
MNVSGQGPCDKDLNSIGIWRTSGRSACYRSRAAMKAPGNVTRPPFNVVLVPGPGDARAHRRRARAAEVRAGTGAKVAVGGIGCVQRI